MTAKASRQTGAGSVPGPLRPGAACVGEGGLAAAACTFRNHIEEEGMGEGGLMGSGKRNDSPCANSPKAEARARRERRLKAEAKKRKARKRTKGE